MTVPTTTKTDSVYKPAIGDIPTSTAPVYVSNNTADPFHPDYYSIPGLNIEAEDIIEALELDFARGSAMKYLVRGGRKPGESETKDLRKAVEYLQKRIAYLERKV